MAHILDSIKTWILNVIPYGAGGYAGSFLLMLLESACIPIPSEITMPVAGFLASEHKLSPLLAIVVGILANLAGSLGSYAVGRAGGRTLFLKHRRCTIITP